MNAFRLSAQVLGKLPPRIRVPQYNRASLTPGILHIGVGNFHRAHQAMYLHRLFNAGLDHDWGIIGAGVRPADVAMREVLRAQDCLTTVIELDPDGHCATICGSMIDYAPVNPAAIIDTLSQAKIRIVTLTVTEGGYYYDASSNSLDVEHPDIVHDLQQPDNPRSVFGILTEALRRRRKLGLQPFTIVSCDNLPENGNITRQMMMELSSCTSADMANWLGAEVAFPNSMVDCITPATGERERNLAKNEFGLSDASPVVCEPYRQWVMEDRFSNDRPALEQVGVEFVENVAAYELMKLRILNGGHAALAYAAALLGYQFVHEAMKDPLIKAFLSRLVTEEIIPTLKPIDGVRFEIYLGSVLRRFSNPGIEDTIARLCFDGSNRQPKFILPTLIDRLKSGLGIDGLALVSALWCRFCLGEQDDGTPISVNDDNAAKLKDHAERSKSDPSVFLSMEEIYGDLKNNQTFVDAFGHALERLSHEGTASTLQGYIRGGA